MVLQATEQLYFASLRYYSKKKKIVEIAVWSIKIIDLFKFNFQEDIYFR